MASEPKNLAEALIAFQASVPTIHENDSSFHGKFANLPGVLGTINPALRSAGLVISQLPESIDGQPGLRTTLMHTSGEQISAVTPLAVAGGKNVTQEWGKAVTYSRRYALQSVLGICVGIEDNDADASASTSAPTPAQKHKKATTKPVVLVRKDAPPVVEEVAKAFAEAVDGEIVTPVQTPAKQDPEPVSDPEGPLSPELQKELVDGTIPALPGDYVETFCKAFAIHFRTGNKKIRNCFTHYKHYTWTQDYFAKHPLPAVQS